MRPFAVHDIAEKTETTLLSEGGSKVVTVTGCFGNTSVAIRDRSSNAVVQTTTEPPVFGMRLQRGNARKTAIYHPTVTTSLSSRVRVGRGHQPPLRAPVRARAEGGGVSGLRKWPCSETTCQAGKGLGLLVGLSALTLLAACGHPATCTGVTTGEVRRGQVISGNYGGIDAYVVRDRNGIEGTIDGSNSDDWRCRADGAAK